MGAHRRSDAVCGKRHVKYLCNGLRAQHVGRYEMPRSRCIRDFRPINGNRMLGDRRTLGRVGYRVILSGSIRGRVEERLI